jgi:thioredoxin 1
MTEEPEENIINLSKLDIPNFNDQDATKFLSDNLHSYPNYNPSIDIVIYPYMYIPSRPNQANPYSYEGKRCIVNNCEGNYTDLHHEHMFHIFSEINQFLINSYNLDRIPEPISTYMAGVLTILTELLSPTSSSFHKDHINTKTIKQTLEILSKQSQAVSTFVKSTGKVKYRPQHKDDKIEHINNLDDFYEKVMYSNTPVLADFWADWCGPCHALSPILSDISYEMSDKIKIVKINVDKQDELSSRFNVESMPTMILFKNGQEFTRIVGVKDKEYIIETIQQTLSEQ